MCNHPELFERREAKSPYHFVQSDPYVLPKFVYRHGLLSLVNDIPSRRHLLYGLFYIWHAQYIHQSLFATQGSGGSSSSSNSSSFAAFSRFMALSPFDLFDLMNRGVVASLAYGRRLADEELSLHHDYTWQQPAKNRMLIIGPASPSGSSSFSFSSGISFATVSSSRVLRSMVFTRAVGTGYAHLQHSLHSTPETIEHRLLRGRKSKMRADLPEFPHVSRPLQILDDVWTEMPAVFSLPVTKVSHSTNRDGGGNREVKLIN